MATYSCHTDVCEPKGGVDGDNSTRSKAARLFRLGVFSLVLGVQRINGGLDVCVLDPGSGNATSKQCRARRRGDQSNDWHGPGRLFLGCLCSYPRGVFRSHSQPKDDHHRRGVVGGCLFHLCRSPLRSIQHVISPPEPFDPATSQRLYRIAFPDNSRAFLTNLFTRIQREAPGVAVEWLTPNPEMLPLVAGGQIDICELAGAAPLSADATPPIWQSRTTSVSAPPSRDRVCFALYWQTPEKP